MSAVDAQPAVYESYEALVRTTALMIVTDLRARGMATADDDADDVMQLLRVKVWRAVVRFDPARVKRKGESRTEARDRYVFMCLMDAKKDVFKKKRTLLLMLEDVAPAHEEWAGSSSPGPRDRFDARYLSQSDEQVFAGVEEVPPLIPNTLSNHERAVMLLLYRDYTHREIALRLDISRSDVSSAVRSLKAKLGDWAPPGEPMQTFANLCT